TNHQLPAIDLAPEKDGCALIAAGNNPKPGIRRGPVGFGRRSRCDSGEPRAVDEITVYDGVRPLHRAQDVLERVSGRGEGTVLGDSRPCGALSPDVAEVALVKLDAASVAPK